MTFVNGVIIINNFMLGDEKTKYCTNIANKKKKEPGGALNFKSDRDARTTTLK